MQTSPNFESIVSRANEMVQQQNQEAVAIQKRHTGETLLAGFRQSIESTTTPKMGTTYSHVDDWFQQNQTMSFDDAIDRVEAYESNHHDIKTEIDDIQAEIQGGELIVRANGREYKCQPAVRPQLLARLDLPTTTFDLIVKDGDSEIVNQLIGNRMKHWHDYANKVRNAERRSKATSKVLLRTHDMGGGEYCLRALLAERFAKIPHSFILGALNQICQGNGLISHFDIDRFERGIGDYMKFNVLFPDQVQVIGRRGSHGAMLAVDNHECGGGQYHASAASMSYVCGNGLILGKQTAASVSERHTGVKDFQQIAIDLHNLCADAFSVNGQIAAKIEKVEQNDFRTDGLPVEHFIAAQFSRPRMPTVGEARGIYGALYAEPQTGTAIDVINAITRYAQTAVPQRRWELETLGGQLLERWTDESRLTLDVQNAVDWSTRANAKSKDRNNGDAYLSRVLSAELTTAS